MDNGLNLLFDITQATTPKEEHDLNDEHTIIDDKQGDNESGLEKDSNAFIQSIIKEADEAIPDSIQNYSSLMQIQEDIFDSMLKKIEMGKVNESGSYDNATIGIFKDLEEEYYKAKKNWDCFIQFFHAPLNKDDMQFINTLKIMNVLIEKIQVFSMQSKELDDYVSDIQESLDKINSNNGRLAQLDDTMKEFCEYTANQLHGEARRIQEQFCSTLEQTLQHKITHYDNFLTHFINKEGEKIKELSDIATDITKNTKKILILVAIIFAIFGTSLGALSVALYTKYKQFQALDSNLTFFSKKLHNINITRNDNTITIKAPKQDIQTTTKDNYFYLTIGGVK
ncbi:hypothetical protein [Helicobacter trogontum]|uniref:Uncharacterized protein n=1 Tax=Helicobacter trogontum TaxID=50960 RepID=A0A4U8T8S2_9HELI|nr:hypothetical protein [Helicobacter trogontum]MDY5184426.1 hypothetical protein [Helicobacter trogontum]TLD96130.1 hypothetical protein LS80_008805 [Helicobacter trogontum]